MAFISFIGRLLFVSLFVLSAYQEFTEFGVDGGPAAKSLRLKYDVFSNHVTTQTGIQIPHVDMKHLILGAIIMKSIGSLLFVFDSTFGAVILLLHQAIATPILFDFYNYEPDKKEFNQLFVKFTQGLALLGALLFFIGMKNSLPRRSPKKKATKAKTN
ncbi:uncharacterized protein LOC130991263 [Salvia miltiorrhiza]|uniref:uncharacterized protein LOC130991263 n=1 Tax=Salvia miltiorrhiza TaxID=226208 RepID=UPI0025AC9A26|nr:uncharacterized protein LOC130991263 [Salvia miltiorrhiza]